MLQKTITTHLYDVYCENVRTSLIKEEIINYIIHNNCFKPSNAVIYVFTVIQLFK